MSEPILLAKNDRADVFMLPKMANRHGAITGATGTGKTVTLQARIHGRYQGRPHRDFLPRWRQ
jgi:type IV secretory pathway VirB4 component